MTTWSPNGSTRSAIRNRSDRRRSLPAGRGLPRRRLQGRDRARRGGRRFLAAPARRRALSAMAAAAVFLLAAPIEVDARRLLALLDAGRDVRSARARLAALHLADVDVARARVAALRAIGRIIERVRAAVQDLRPFGGGFLGRGRNAFALRVRGVQIAERPGRAEAAA